MWFPQIFRHGKCRNFCLPAALLLGVCLVSCQTAPDALNVALYVKDKSTPTGDGGYRIALRGKELIDEQGAKEVFHQKARKLVKSAPYSYRYDFVGTKSYSMQVPDYGDQIPMLFYAANPSGGGGTMISSTPRAKGAKTIFSKDFGIEGTVHRIAPISLNRNLPLEIMVPSDPAQGGKIQRGAGRAVAEAVLSAIGSQFGEVSITSNPSRGGYVLRLQILRWQDSVLEDDRLTLECTLEDRRSHHILATFMVLEKQAALSMELAPKPSHLVKKGFARAWALYTR